MKRRGFRATAIHRTATEPPGLDRAGFRNPLYRGKGAALLAFHAPGAAQEIVVSSAGR